MSSITHSAGLSPTSGNKSKDLENSNGVPTALLTSLQGFTNAYSIRIVYSIPSSICGKEFIVQAHTIRNQRGSGISSVLRPVDASEPYLSDMFGIYQ
jgi:hypothetical protein